MCNGVLACMWVCPCSEADGFGGFPNGSPLHLPRQSLWLSQLARWAHLLALRVLRLCILSAVITGHASCKASLFAGTADLNSGVLTLYPRSFVPSPKGRSKARKFHISRLFSTVTLRNLELEDYSGRGICGSLKDFKWKRHLREETLIERRGPHILCILIWAFFTEHMLQGSSFWSWASFKLEVLTPTDIVLNSCHQRGCNTLRGPGFLPC